MSQDLKFEGWLGLNKDAVGNMEWRTFEPKPFEETDVDIQVTHAGICGTDLHTLRSSWEAMPADYPVCVGHEIVGKAVRVGSQVKRPIKVGDRVGVGGQCNSCLKPDCEECQNDMENYCSKMQPTYNSKHPDGSKAYGGYANYARVPGHFVFNIPDGLPSEAAAPMLCAGSTMWGPLVDNGCGPGKKVGIIGFGGLGHFGLLFAKVLGADKVVVISRSNAKKADALKMGADEYIATAGMDDWSKTHANTLDLVLSTVDGQNMPLEDYLKLLRVKGQLIQLGAPEGKLPRFDIFALLIKGAKLGASAIASPKQIEDMLNLAAEKGVRPWVTERPMKDANKALLDMDAGKARYRYVLTN